MREYTSPSQRARNLVAKYGITEEEAHKIVFDHEDCLTIEELKMKYDSPDLSLSSFPEWLSCEELYDMCGRLLGWLLKRMEATFDADTKFDLISQVFEDMYLRINQFNSINHVKTAIINRYKNIFAQHNWRGVYKGPSFEEIFDYNSDGVPRTYSDVICGKDHYKIQNAEVVQSIRNIKDDSIRHFMIIVSYLLCDMVELRSDYLEVLKCIDNTARQNILELANKIAEKQDYDVSRELGLIKDIGKRGYRPVKSEHIIKALKLNVFEVFSQGRNGAIRTKKVCEKPSETLAMIEDYLRSTSFC